MTVKEGSKENACNSGTPSLLSRPPPPDNDSTSLKKWDPGCKGHSRMNKKEIYLLESSGSSKSAFQTVPGMLFKTQ